MRPQDRPRPVPTRPVSATRKARQAALDRYGLNRFLRDWDALLGDAATDC
ncbi:hypothetical protein [Parafrankia soli]|nr:hypothetical protein [Parafrankia soli]